MIIGNGLIANTFKEYNFSENFIIFASGVSNSINPSVSDFNREYDLLMNIKCENISEKCLVYFSSCGVIAENSQYYTHKKTMELLVQNNFKKYIILRLPQVIGKSKNNSTLINFLTNSIENYTKIQLFNNATRYFIEVNDLLSIFNYLIQNNENFNKIHNIAIPIKYTIFEILNIIENILKKNANYDIIEGGTDYTLDLRYINNILYNLNLHYDKNYLKISLLKNIK